MRYPSFILQFGLCAILLFGCTLCYGQRATYAYWPFPKYAALNFNTEPPQPDSSSANDLTEPCASICDSSGRLLFYTDGIHIWNRLHRLMPHGFTVSKDHDMEYPFIVILPCATRDRYEIFISHYYDKRAQKHIGIQCCTVDMRLDGGLGDLANKLRPCYDSVITGAMTAVKRPAGGYWILCSSFSHRLRSDDIVAIAFDNDTCGEAIESSIGSFGIIEYPLKASFKGDFLVGGNACFDFDKESGRISNARALHFKYNIDDVAFSPDDSFFYTSTISYPWTAYITQVNRYSKDFKDVVYLPLKEKYKKDEIGIGSLQTGPDGKVYYLDIGCYAAGSYGGYIMHPNRRGAACGLVTDALYYGSCDLRLFSFPQVIYPGFVSFQAENGCSGIQFRNTSDSIFRRFTWYWGDGDSVASDYSVKELNHLYIHPGKYFVKVKGTTKTGYTAWSSDSITVESKIAVTLNVDSAICQWSPISLRPALCFQAMDTASASYAWDFGDGLKAAGLNQAHVFSRPGKFNICLYLLGQKTKDSLIWSGSIQVAEAPKALFTVNDSIGCGSLLAQIINRSSGMSNAYLYTTSNGQSSTEASPVFYFDAPGRYRIWQQVSGLNAACVSRDSIDVIVHESTGTPVIKRLSVEHNDHIHLAWNAEPSKAYRLLRSKDGVQFLNLASTTDTTYDDYSADIRHTSYWYKLLAEDSCGNISSQSNVVKSILLSGETEGNDYCQLSWNDYEDSRGKAVLYRLYEDKEDSSTEITHGSFTAYKDNQYLDPELMGKCYHVAALLADGSTSASNTACFPYAAHVWVPNIFTPNGDGINDSFRVTTTGIRTFEIEIFNRWGEKVYISDNKNFRWDGLDKGQRVPGIYLYRISAQGMNGEQLTRNGTILMEDAKQY